MHEEIPEYIDLVHAGDPLPHFTVVLNDGSTVSKESLLGTPAVIVFFNTSCHDCQRELPVLNSQYLADTTRRWVCISREEGKESIEKFWKEKNLSLPYSAQTDRSIYNLFAISGIPRLYLVNEEGIIEQTATSAQYQR